jgi:hypothetical protein
MVPKDITLVKVSQESLSCAKYTGHFVLVPRGLGIDKTNAGVVGN